MSAVVVAEEHLLSIIAAMRNVQRVVGRSESESTGHNLGGGLSGAGKVQPVLHDLTEELGLFTAASIIAAAWFQTRRRSSGRPGAR